MKMFIRNFIAPCIISGIALASASPALGANYADATGDLLPATAGLTHCDITSVVVTNDATNISFTIYLAGDPIAVNTGEYNIGIDAISSAGATNGVVPGGSGDRPITMSVGGMDYWIRSWDTGAELYHWAGSYWYGDWFTWAPPSDVQVPVKTTNSVTLTTTLASLNLVGGQTFKFDVYATEGSGSNSAIDALANPNPTAASGDYVTAYDSGTNVYAYTVTGSGPTNTFGAAYTDTQGDLLPATAGFKHCDIVAFDITNDATNITFKFYLTGDPIANNWGQYNIGINSIDGAGATNGTVPPNRPITMSVGGMDYWIRSWDGGAELYHWDGAEWYGDWFTWAPPSDIQVPVKTTNSVSLTTTLASLGLSAGQTFKFDAYTTGGTDTDPAWDALANPNPTAASGDYVTPYDSGNNVYIYTVKGPAPTNTFGAAYNDTKGDLQSATAGNKHCDIVAFDITNDATNISFKFYLAGDPIANNWAQYNVAINSINGAGATNGTVPPNRPITMSVGGMDYWIRSWDGGAELYHWNGSLWYGDWFTWAPPSDIQIPVKTTNSVTLTTTLASLGLSPGQTFKFDAYTCGGTDTDSAWDALANPNPTAASGDYVTPYDSGTNVYTYTVKGTAVLTNNFGAAYSDAPADMLPATAGNTHCDIVAFDITNDATYISFKFYLSGNPIATSWGEYNIGIDSISGGAVSGTVPPNRPITMSVGGMDYWIRSWDTGAELYHWAGSYWYGDWFTWAPPSDIQVPVKTTNSVTLTTTLASLGLSPGQTLKFDAYTCGGTGTDSAWDALANPYPTAASGDYVTPYDSGTNVFIYTVQGTTAVSPILASPSYSGTTFSVQVPTQSGFNYILEYKNSLSDPSWTPIQTNNGTGGLIPLADLNGNVPQRFYRVRVQ